MIREVSGMSGWKWRLEGQKAGKSATGEFGERRGRGEFWTGWVGWRGGEFGAQRTSTVKSNLALRILGALHSCRVQVKY